MGHPDPQITSRGGGDVTFRHSCPNAIPGAHLKIRRESTLPEHRFGKPEDVVKRKVFRRVEGTEKMIVTWQFDLQDHHHLGIVSAVTQDLVASRR